MFSRPKTIPLFIIACLTLNISGCFPLTKKVNEIGLYELEGTTQWDNTSVETEIELRKRQVYFPNLVFKPTPTDDSFPYDKIIIDLNTIEWGKTDIQGKRYGKLHVNFNGENVAFEATVYEGQLTLSTRHREWYNYPSKILLVGSVPVDMVLWPGLIVGGAVVSVVIATPLAAAAFVATSAAELFTGEAPEAEKDPEVESPRIIDRLPSEGAINHL